MKIRFNTKYNTIAAYAIIVFAACLLLCMFAFRIEVFQAAFSKIIHVSSPILWGLVIAYLLNPLTKRIEYGLGKLLNRKRKHKKLVRGLSVAMSVLLLLAVFVGLIASIIPGLISNIQSISEKVQDPYFFSSMELKVRTIFAELSEKTEFLGDTFQLNFDSIESFLLSVIDTLELNRLFSKDGLFASLTNTLVGVFGGIKNVLLGLIVSVYLLLGKEMFLAQSKKVVHAFCPPDRAGNIFRFVSNVNRKFIGYFTGVALDSTMVGVVTFIFMLIFKMPYAVLLSVLVGVTNAIPIFGPYIGAIPSCLLLMLFSPIKALIFLVFCIILQQIDGNIVAPKILGDQLGLSAFWIMCAVFIGGGLFGIVGMIVASPVFAVIYSICSELTREHLDVKGMPTETEAYMEQEILPDIPPVSEKAVKAQTEQNGGEQ